MKNIFLASILLISITGFGQNITDPLGDASNALSVIVKSIFFYGGVGLVLIGFVFIALNKSLNQKGLFIAFSGAILIIMRFLI